MTLILTIAAAMAAVASAGTGDVRIAISDVREGTGDLYVGLQKRDEFMQDGGSHGEVIKLPKAGRHDVVFKGVTPGEYAVTVWHDVNGNRQFDKDRQHVPLDGWAMINGETLRGEPTFDQVKFAVDAGSVSLTLPVIYGDAAGRDTKR